MNANLFAIIRERIGSQANVLLRTVEGAVVTYGDMLERIRISGEGVTAVVVKQTAAALSQDSIRDALAERLAKFKLPKPVRFVDPFAAQQHG
jgi:malonyl-CoA/methylmalonyl-CoA synthetase